MTADELVTMTVCGLFAVASIVYGTWSNRRAHDADQSARRAAALMRREAEQHAAEDPLEIDRGRARTAPLRLVTVEEARESLLADAVRRHPAGSKSSPAIEQRIRTPARRTRAGSPAN